MYKYVETYKTRGQIQVFKWSMGPQEISGDPTVDRQGHFPIVFFGGQLIDGHTAPLHLCQDVGS